MNKIKWNYKMKGLRNTKIAEGIVIEDKLYYAISYQKKEFYESKVIQIDLGDNSIEELLEIPHLITKINNVDSNILYFSAFDGKVYSIDLKSNEVSIIYTVNPTRNLNPNIMVFDDDLCFSEMHGQSKYTYCINKHTHELKWKHDNEHSSASMFESIDSNLYYATNGGPIYCVDRNEGSTIWRTTNKLYIQSLNKLNDKYIVVGTSDGKVIIHDAYNGELIDNIETSNSIYKKALIIDENIYVGNDNGDIYCLSFDEQALLVNIKWKIELESKLTTPIKIYKDNIILGLEDKRTIGVCKDTGTVLYEKRVKEVPNDILFYNDEVLILSGKGQVHSYI